MRIERIFTLLWQRMELLFEESLKLVDYPTDVAVIESLVVCGRLVYFVSAKGPRTVGGL